VSVANVLTTGSRVTGGKTYYQYEILTRTADGDEGGRHHLFATTVSNGKLYILKMQAGDKRWFKGTERELARALVMGISRRLIGFTHARAIHSASRRRKFRRAFRSPSRRAIHLSQPLHVCKTDSSDKPTRRVPLR